MGSTNKTYWLVTAGLLVLLGVGLAVRGVVRHKKENTPALTAKVASASGKQEDWNSLLATFRPEGDRAARAQQRIAFLQMLIARFPDDKGHRLAARMELANLHESQKQFKDAAECLESFMQEAPDGDARRVQALESVVRCWALAGDARKMSAAFAPVCTNNFKEALILAHKVSRRLAGEDGRIFCAKNPCYRPARWRKVLAISAAGKHCAF